MTKILTTTRSLLDVDYIYGTINREIELANKAIKRASKVIKRIERDG